MILAVRKSAAGDRLQGELIDQPLGLGVIDKAIQCAGDSDAPQPGVRCQFGLDVRLDPHEVALIAGNCDAAAAAVCIRKEVVKVSGALLQMATHPLAVPFLPTFSRSVLAT